MKLNSNNAIVTYVYPSVLKYFQECLLSIKSQNNQDFDLIVFSDGVSLDQVEDNDLKFQLISLSGSPFSIRNQSFEILKLLNYDNLIFIDADDTMTTNRIDVLLHYLKSYAIVCNDINLMDYKGQVYEQSIWGSRLGNEFKFISEFIIDKNIIGFGNTGITKKLLSKYVSNTDYSTLAVDWFFFYQLMKKNNETAFFTNECKINYRQHKENTAGIRNISFDSIKKTLQVKRMHYEALINAGFLELKEELEKLNAIDLSNLNLDKLNKLPNHLFWWEENNFIK